MNTKSLAKNYGSLTPWERLPLIMAAAARNDETERERLVALAPRVVYRVPDHFGLALALSTISHLHYMELLDLAGRYLRYLEITDDPDEECGMRMLNAALMCGYAFKVKLAGWRQFCAEYKLDPELVWSCFPGYETLKRAEKVAERAGFFPEGALAYAKEQWGDDTELLTAEAVAADLKACLEARAEWWG